MATSAHASGSTIFREDHFIRIEAFQFSPNLLGSVRVRVDDGQLAPHPLLNLFYRLIGEVHGVISHVLLLLDTVGETQVLCDGLLA